MNTTRQDEELNKVGVSAYEAIKEMVDALQCDWGRLQELRDDREGWEPNDDEEDWTTANPDDAEELKELEEARGDHEDEDSARQAIQEDALSVEVGGWWTPGTSDPEPTEYRILLTTGGPAVRIVGELGQYDEPSTARLEVQNWFKPWTEYGPANEDVLLAYAQCHYFGA